MNAGAASHMLKAGTELLSRECSPQPLVLRVVLIWTPNPSMPGPDHSHRVFKIAPKGESLGLFSFLLVVVFMALRMQESH